MTGLEISRNFYSQGKCVLESDIEYGFIRYYEIINPRIISGKASFGKYHTDGIIRFYNDNNEVLFWILQETKRDCGLNSVWFIRSLLQSMMYLGNIYYDVNVFGPFNGIFLNSARYFSYVPKSEVDYLMSEFEELWWKYYKTAPSSAYKVPELLDYIIEHIRINNIYRYNLDSSFILDDLLNSIYKKAI